MQSLIEDKSLYQLKISSLPYESLQNIGISPLHTYSNNGYMELEINEKEENIPLLMNHLIENGTKVYSCKRKETNLEDIFEKLIQNS